MFLTIVENEKEEENVDISTRGGPYIDKIASRNVTVQKGKTAMLSCRVSNLGDEVVSI